MWTLEQAIAWSQFGLLGMFGGVASYFYPPSTELRFEWKLFLGKLIMSFFVGRVAGDFIPDAYQYKAGIIPVLGFFAYPVLGVLEQKVKDLVSRYHPPGVQ